MNPEIIKANLRIKGATLTALADKLGLSRSMVTQVIYGHARSRKVEELIAQTLGLTVREIWPSHKPALRRTRAQVAAARQGAAA